MTTNRRILFFGSLAVSALVVAFGGGLLVAAQGAGSGAPYLLPYQGVLELEGELVDTQGQAQGVTFSVRIEDGAGVKVWPDGDWEVHEGVPVHAGRFALMLGAITTLPEALFDGGPRFAHLQVEYAGSGTVDMGRQELLAAPHALRARRATVAETAEKLGTTTMTVHTYAEVCSEDKSQDDGEVVTKLSLLSKEEGVRGICFLTKSFQKLNHLDWGDDGDWVPETSCDVFQEEDNAWTLRARALAICNTNTCSHNTGLKICCMAKCLTWK